MSHICRVVRTGLEPVVPGIQIGAINTIPHLPILASTIPPPDQFEVENSFVLCKFKYKLFQNL